MCCKGLAQLEGSWLAQRKGSFQLALDASEVPWCLWHFSFVTITFSHFLTLLLHSGSVFAFDICLHRYLREGSQSSELCLVCEPQVQHGVGCGGRARHCVLASYHSAPTAQAGQRDLVQKMRWKQMGGEWLAGEAWGKCWWLLWLQGAAQLVPVACTRCCMSQADRLWQQDGGRGTGMRPVAGPCSAWQSSAGRVIRPCSRLHARGNPRLAPGQESSTLERFPWSIPKGDISEIIIR